MAPLGLPCMAADTLFRHFPGLPWLDGADGDAGGEAPAGGQVQAEPGGGAEVQGCCQEWQ